jgi:predicted AAA+ superfamily ATPase
MALIERLARLRLLELARGFPVVVVTGPRQAGKTTLVRSAFNDRPWVSLEDPDVRERVALDPRGFLMQFAGGAVIDEVQRVPQLLSYLQTQVDEALMRDTGSAPARFVLTGSQNLMMLQAVTQSLAGRAGIMELMPLSWAELGPGRWPATLDDWIVQGGYPAPVMRGVPIGEWMSSYVGTYLERDVRQISRIGDLLAFQRFMRMLAARTGQLLNLNALAQDLGIAQTTARDWLTVLEASYIVWRLPPYHTNFGKRLVKAAKLYFHDTALACWLLGISTPAMLHIHPMRGALFENMLMTEYLKYCRHFGLMRTMHFWRDHIGNEVDLLIEHAGRIWPVEMKSGATFQSEWLRGLSTWRRHAAQAPQGGPLLISDAPAAGERDGVTLLPWRLALEGLGSAPG